MSVDWDVGAIGSGINGTTDTPTGGGGGGGAERTGDEGGVGGVLFVLEAYSPVSLSQTLSPASSPSVFATASPRLPIVSYEHDNVGIGISSNIFFDHSEPLGLAPSVAIGILLLLLIIFCVIGNLFVITAILIERDLRCRPQYYLVFSLAVADLMVGLIVTPLGALSTLRQSWELGVTLCDFWISVDVLVCTSSILHLVAIALDRYWSVTNISYSNNRTPRRIFSMLMVIWVLSLLISLAPQFGLKDENFVTRVREQQVCLISQDIAYQVFSTSTAFYIPLFAIMLIYYKIMRAAKKRFRRERDRRTVNRTVAETVPPKASKMLIAQQHSPLNCHSQPNGSTSNNNNYSNSHSNNMLGAKLKVKLKLENARQHQRLSNANSENDEEDKSQLHLIASETPNCCKDGEMVAETAFTDGSSIDSDRKRKARSASHQLLAFPRPAQKCAVKKKRGPRETVEMGRERKAWRTLAIITGSFIACWMPFFVLSLYRPICINMTHKDKCESIPPLMEQIFNWLGYLNSALNPIIYTIFSLDFRLAFERILRRIFCRIGEMFIYK
ncbi:hypothetical protein niasHT_021825 [Heterodera trifolii]|uniref:G-protein coupled receptors family 1 profile domain-containing protein n=1 Tax=Heterodera trifolii TaxID=157864 RepID=A0ABD2J8P2_9BILA